MKKLFLLIGLVVLLFSLQLNAKDILLKCTIIEIKIGITTEVFKINTKEQKIIQLIEEFKPASGIVSEIFAYRVKHNTILSKVVINDSMFYGGTIEERNGLKIVDTFTINRIDNSFTHSTKMYYLNEDFIPEQLMEDYKLRGHLGTDKFGSCEKTSQSF